MSQEEAHDAPELSIKTTTHPVPPLLMHHLHLLSNLLLLVQNVLQDGLALIQVAVWAAERGWAGNAWAWPRMHIQAFVITCQMSTPCPGHLPTTSQEAACSALSFALR